MTNETQTRKYTQEEFLRDLDKIKSYVEAQKVPVEGVFPLNKGGHVIAGYLSGRTGLPISTCKCHLNPRDLYVADSIDNEQFLDYINETFGKMGEIPQLPKFAAGMLLISTGLIDTITSPLVMGLRRTKRFKNLPYFSLTKEIVLPNFGKPKEIPMEERPRVLLLHRTPLQPLEKIATSYVNDKPEHVVYPWR